MYIDIVVVICTYAFFLLVVLSSGTTPRYGSVCVCAHVLVSVCAHVPIWNPAYFTMTRYYNHDLKSACYSV